MKPKTKKPQRVRQSHAYACPCGRLGFSQGGWASHRNTCDVYKAARGKLMDPFRSDNFLNDKHLDQ